MSLQDLSVREAQKRIPREESGGCRRQAGGGADGDEILPRFCEGGMLCERI